MLGFMRRPAMVLVAGLFLASLPAPASRPDGAPLRAAPAGALVDTPSGQAEQVQFDPRVVPELLAIAPGTSIRVEDWPVAPGERRAVILMRRDVYAPDAKVLAIDRGVTLELPRSRLAFFTGRVEWPEPTLLMVSVDPDSATISGFALGGQGFHEILPPSPDHPLRHLVIRPEEAREPGAPPLERSCGQESLPDVPRGPAPRAAESLRVPLAATQFVVMAVDTDNEFMNLKFSNNTTSATNYIASLIAGMSAIYERDVPIQILEGYTILRLSTTADPYTGGTGSADDAKLDEFSEYWRTRYGSIRRSIATLLSGKQSSAFSSSGIAWLNALCQNGFQFTNMTGTHTFGGYSFFQVFKFGGATANDDMLVVAHEAGHNFSSPHTHCYADPKPDLCFNAEPGCYSGATSCPALQTINGVSARGTLMSYCHLLGGCSSALVFHPETISRYFTSAIAASSCDFAIGPAAPTITSLSMSSGPTTGGTVFTITGTSFQNGATVAFADLTSSTAATPVVFNGSTSLTVTTPAHAAGIVDAVVMNPDFQTATLRSGFTYGSVLPPLPNFFYTLPPCRVLDTRNANGPLGGPALAAGSTRTFTLTGSCGVSVTARSVSTNVTAVLPGAVGELVIYPGDGILPLASTISFAAGQVRANNALLLLSSDGSGAIQVKNNSAGSVHFVLDVNGYFQ